QSVVSSASLLAVATASAQPLAKVSSPYDRASAQVVAHLQADPEFRSVFAGLTSGEVDLRVRDLARNGLVRLDDATLSTRLGLVAKLLDAADVSTCDAIMEGTAHAEQFANAMRQLSEADAYSYAPSSRRLPLPNSAAGR